MDWIRSRAGETQSVAKRAEAMLSREGLVRQSREVDASFRAVRFGLSFSLTAMLLLAFCLVYVRPQDAAFYPLVLALAGDAVLIAVVLGVARRAKRQYFALIAEAKRQDAQGETCADTETE